MKKLLTIILLFIFSSIAFAQQDTLWRRGGLLSLNFTNVALSHWAGGGEPSMSGASLINLFANYSKGKNSWDNNITLAFGAVKQGEVDWRKSDDQIDISSKYGRKASDHWYYSTLLNFRSQFAEGFNYPNDSVAISKFLSPGYVILATGFDYKPSEHFSLFLSAVTGRLIIVTDKLLSDAGAFGVDSGKTVKAEFGAYIKASFNKDIMENVNLNTTVDVFSNYLDNPGNMVVNWQLLLSLKVNKFLSASIATQLIYDDKVLVPVNDDNAADGLGKRVQIKEVLGIGLAYKLEGVSVKKK